MKFLGLMRHAKSDWDDLSLRDFDRGLNKRGRKGAALMGQHITDQGTAWEKVLASPAERVRRTLEASGLDLPVTFLDWSPGQPNDPNGQEDCVVIDGAVDAPDTLGKMLGLERFQQLRETRGNEHDGLMLPAQIAETYVHLAKQHRSTWTHELDLRPWLDRLCEWGLVGQSGRTQATRYFVKPELLRTLAFPAVTEPSLAKAGFSLVIASIVAP